MSDLLPIGEMAKDILIDLNETIASPQVGAKAEKLSKLYFLWLPGLGGTIGLKAIHDGETIRKTVSFELIPRSRDSSSLWGLLNRDRHQAGNQRLSQPLPIFQLGRELWL